MEPLTRPQLVAAAFGALAYSGMIGLIFVGALSLLGASNAWTGLIFGPLVMGVLFLSAWIDDAQWDCSRNGRDAKRLDPEGTKARWP
jgi:hypothetical protein